MTRGSTISSLPGRRVLRCARGAWQTVREAIDRMSPEQRREAAWTYWYGRALAAQGEATGSRAYYLRIAGQTDFYGLLANEELGYVGTVPVAGYTPTDDDVAKARANPGLARALELIRLGMRTEGVREWLFTIRYFDDKRLLAAAELARREGVYDRAIHTADRTVRTHNFALRYPVPYYEVFSRVRQDLQPRRSLGARARAAGKPLRHRRALGRRRRRPDAGDAAAPRSSWRSEGRACAISGRRTSSRSRPTSTSAPAT